jgi:hypothetical protein
MLLIGASLVFHNKTVSTISKSSDSLCQRGADKNSVQKAALKDFTAQIL